MSSLTPKEGGTYQPSTPSSRTPIWIPVVLVVAVIAVAAVAYGQYSSNLALQARIDILEGRLQEKFTSLQKNETSLASDIDLVTKKVGVTETELNAARKFAEASRQETEAANSKISKLQGEVATKANTTDVESVQKNVVAAREEAASKVAEVQKTADAKIGVVAGDVKTVDAKLDATNRDLAESKRALVDVKNTLSEQIAKNSSELAALKLKGEREYFEFELKKAKKDEMQRVGDIRLALKDTDTKKQRYDIMIQVDDNKLEKKDKLVNEPLQFLVGRDKLRYEVVINKVDKDKIAGYLSIPKDKTLSAERPVAKN